MKGIDKTRSTHNMFVTVGASNHTESERAENDFYATDPVAIAMLAQTGFFNGVESVWEPACGAGHLVEALEGIVPCVYATDLVDHGAEGGYSGVDFLVDNSVAGGIKVDAIVTNPPYKLALEFCERAISLAPKVAMFLKLTFLEGQKRFEFYQNNPPRYVAVCVNRVQCARNGDPEMMRKSSAACYAWFIWERGFKGNPEILFIPKPKNY